MTLIFRTSIATVAFAALAGSALAQMAPDPNDPNDPTAPADPDDPTYPEDVTSTPDPIVSPPTDPAPAEPVAVDPTTTYVPPYEETDDDYSLAGIGVSISAGAGVAGFTSDSLRGTTTDGGLWDVRAAIGTKLPLAFEASYVGSAQPIDALGLDTDAVLVSNGAQGALRLNVINDAAVRPYVFGGAAWRRYEVMNADVNTSDIAGSDDVFEIPLGVGLAYAYRGFLLDARGEFRAAMEEDLMPSRNELGEDADMHRYGVNVNIGYEF